jgi:hypothetical protein
MDRRRFAMNRTPRLPAVLQESARISRRAIIACATNLLGARQRALKWRSIHRRLHRRELGRLVGHEARRSDWTAPRHAREGAGARKNLAMI